MPAKNYGGVRKPLTGMAAIKKIHKQVRKDMEKFKGTPLSRPLPPSLRYEDHASADYASPPQSEPTSTAAPESALVATAPHPLPPAAAAAVAAEEEDPAAVDPFSHTFDLRKAPKVKRVKISKADFKKVKARRAMSSKVIPKPSRKTGAPAATRAQRRGRAATSNSKVDSLLGTP